MKKRGLVVICLFCHLLLHAQTYQPNWASLDQRPVPQWFRDAKFGIFIHWGVYSVPGWSSKGQYAEWYQNGLNNGDTARISFHKKKFGDRSYYQLADDFKAERYDPVEWANIIEKSGARYVVLTSKHHDGWANWPSAQTAQAWSMPWNAGVAGPHRDLLGDLFTALRKTSVHPGMYYSLYEWFNPLYKKDKAAYVANYMWPQMKDLITTYRPDVFWTDGEWDGPDTLWKSTQFLAWLYNESPVKDDVVTYDRWGSGVRFHHGGVYTPEYQPNIDFEDHPWEESRGMGMSYGYNREEDSWDYNSAQSLVLQLIDKVSRGGNFLLDIGPDEHGKIPPIMEERLLQIGDWMRFNREAIYETTRWRTPSQWSLEGNWHTPKKGEDPILRQTADAAPGDRHIECFFTYNAARNNLYALLPKWPVDSFTVRGLEPPPGTVIELLETHEKLAWESNRMGDCVIRLPRFDPSRIKTAYAFVIKFSHFGDFAPKPKVSFSYDRKTGIAYAHVKEVPGITYRYNTANRPPSEPYPAEKWPGDPVYTKPVPAEKRSISIRGFKPNAIPSEEFSDWNILSGWDPPMERPGRRQPGLHYYAYQQTEDRNVSVPQLKILDSGVASIPEARYIPPKSRNVLLEFAGTFYAEKDDIYTFYLAADEGAEMWLHEHVVIDVLMHYGEQERSCQLPLKKGHHFMLFRYTGGHGGHLSLQYSTDMISRRPVPDSLLFHSER